MSDLSQISCCKCGNCLPEFVIFPCGHFVCRKCEGISSCLVCNQTVCILKDSLSLQCYRKMVSEGLLLPRGKRPASKTSFNKIEPGKSTSSKRVDSCKLTKGRDISKLQRDDPNLTPRSTRASSRSCGQRQSLNENLLGTLSLEDSQSPTIANFSLKKNEIPSTSGLRATNRDRVAPNIKVKDSLQIAVDVETPDSSKKSTGKTQKTRLSATKKLDLVPNGVPHCNEIVPCDPPPSKRRKIFGLPSRLSLRPTKRHIDSSDEDDNIFIDSASEVKSNAKSIEVVAQVHADPCFSPGSQEEWRTTNDVGGNDASDSCGDISDDFVGFKSSSQECIDSKKRGGSPSSDPISSTSIVSSGIGPKNALPSTETQMSTIPSSPDDSYIKSSMTPVEGVGVAQIFNIPKLSRRNKMGAMSKVQSDHEGRAKNIPTVSKLDMVPCVNYSPSVCLVDCDSIQSSNKFKSSIKSHRRTEGTKVCGIGVGDDAKSYPNRIPENEPLPIAQPTTNVRSAANPHINISDVSTITNTSTATNSEKCETDGETSAGSMIKRGSLSVMQSTTSLNIKQPLSGHLDIINFDGENLICRCDIKAECNCKRLTASKQKNGSNSDRTRDVADPNIILPLTKVTNDAADSGEILISNDEYLLSSKEEKAFDPIHVQKSEKVGICKFTRNPKDMVSSRTNVAHLTEGTCRDLTFSGELDGGKHVIEPALALSGEDDSSLYSNQETEPMELDTSCSENSVQSVNEDPLHENSPSDVRVAVSPAKQSLIKPCSVSLQHLSDCFELSTTDKSNYFIGQKISPNVRSSRENVLKYHQEIFKSWPTVHGLLCKLFAKIYSEERPKSLSRLAVDVLLKPLREEKIFQGLTTVSPLTDSAVKSAQLGIFLEQSTVKVDVGQGPTKRNSFTRRQLSFAGDVSSPPRGDNAQAEVESEDIVECTPTKLNAVRVNLLNDSVCSPLSRTIVNDDSFTVSRRYEGTPSTHRSQSSKDEVGQVATTSSSGIIVNRTPHSRPVTSLSSEMSGISENFNAVSSTENNPSEPAQWPHCFGTFQDRLPSSIPNCQQLASSLVRNNDESPIGDAGKQKEEYTSSKLNTVGVNQQTVQYSMCSPLTRTIGHKEPLQEALDQMKMTKSLVENRSPHSRTVTRSSPKSKITVTVYNHQIASNVENEPTIPSECPNNSGTVARKLLGSTQNCPLGTTLVHSDSESIIGNSEQFQQQKKKARLALPLDANNLPWSLEDIQERYTSPRPFRNITDILEITTSGIYDRQQIAAVHKLCSLIKATYAKDVTQETTHLIIPSSDNVNVTSKFLMALYIGSYILPFSWIRDCLESESILPEMNYILSYPGVQKRMSLPRGATLFDNYAFYLSPEIHHEDEVNYSALRKLMEFCGCKIVDSFKEIIQTACKYNAVILRHANFDDSVKQSGIIQVSYQWFYACLTCYQIQPVNKPVCLQ